MAYRQMQLPVPVAIVSAGVAQPYWRDVQQAMPMTGSERDRALWHYVHAPDFLTIDPDERGGVGHLENGQYDNTIAQVMGQEQFGDLIERVCCDVGNDVGGVDSSAGRGLVVSCNKGYHRYQ